MKLPTFLTDILTEADNRTFCVISISGAVAILTLAGTLVWAVIVNKAALGDAGVQLGAALGGMGGALWAKGRANPPS